MKILHSNVDAANRIAEAVNIKYDPEMDQCLSCYLTPSELRFDNLIGGVIYQNYTGSSIEMHVAVFKHIMGLKDMFWCSFHMPFNKIGVNKIFAPVRQSNRKGIAFVTGMGFTPEAVLTDRFPNGESLIYYSMTKNKCKYLNIRKPQVTEPIFKIDGKETTFLEVMKILGVNNSYG